MYSSSRLSQSKKGSTRKKWIAFEYFCLLLFSGFIMHGCHLLTIKTAEVNQNNILKPLPKQLDAIDLNIVFAERNKEDPLIGEELWNEVDQIATIAPDQRQRLRELGIAVGVTGSQPTRTIQRLLNLKTEITDHASSSKEHALVGKETTLPSGSRSEIQTSITIPKIDFSNTPIAKISNQTLTNVRCVLNIQAERLQDGWVKLVFIPEIHHGFKSFRPRAGNEKFEFRESQDVIPLYDYKFEVKISLGEMVVIGHDPQRTDSLAEHFFTGENKDGITSRVIIIRLIDMKSLDPIYQESSYSRY